LIVSKVSQLLNGRPLAKVETGATAREACRVMCELDVTAVVVVEHDELVGVLSERDIVRRLVCPAIDPATTTVETIMTPLPQAMDANGDLAEAIEIMRTGRFHHVPVLDNGDVIGLLSADDIPEEYRMLLERFREMRGD
jgi:CBS domain-containing protein